MVSVILRRDYRYNTIMLSAGCGTVCVWIYTRMDRGWVMTRVMREHTVRGD